MSHLLCLVLMFLGVNVAARAVPMIAKREVLPDLSRGFCRNWKFGANIANDVLYMNGLDGGIVPGDNNGSNNYLVELNLSAPIDLGDGANYKLSTIPSNVPKLKDQALWANAANTTLFSYGGRGANGTSSDDGVWTYNIADNSWRIQQTSVKPVRLVSGAYVNAPEIQASYWIGGLQDSDTTPSITDKTRTYATGMIQFNTTTQEFTLLDAPFTPVQEGALVYLPVKKLGALIFFGGEVPSAQSGINVELTPNAWNYVQVYDIEEGVWYNQTTTGNVTPRTQFCASVVTDADPSYSINPQYHIYVISGADFETREIVTGVSYLSIPSFKWYQARGLSTGRMSHVCQTYGRQIFGIGGRQAWADNSSAGCYNMPAFIYDAQSEVVRNEFDPALSTYSVPSATANDIQASPYPSEWANNTLRFLFPGTSGSTYQRPTRTSRGGADKGAIAGGVVGGVAGAAIIASLIWWFLRCRRRKAQELDGTQLESEPKSQVLEELPAEQVYKELHSHPRNELQGDTALIHELDSSPSDGQVEGQEVVQKNK
ncbi:hypothetical protein BDW62DRAFT_209634 [Aspergillus aurantiobrunneus]